MIINTDIENNTIVFEDTFYNTIYVAVSGDIIAGPDICDDKESVAVIVFNKDIDNNHYILYRYNNKGNLVETRFLNKKITLSENKTKIENNEIINEIKPNKVISDDFSINDMFKRLFRNIF